MPSFAILFELINGEKISIQFSIMQDGWGDMDDGIILCSPREMGTQKTINDLVNLLEQNVMCDSEYGHGKIFIEDVSMFTSEEVKNNALEFISKIKNIPSMDDIEKITVDLSYDISYETDEYIEQSTTYVYNRLTNEYTYKIIGDFYNDDTYFTDYRKATLIN